MTKPLKWGGPPLALLPTPLADRLSGVRLPDWLADLLGKPGAAAAALTAAAWADVPEDPAVHERIRTYVADLVAGRATELRTARIGGPPAASVDALTLATWPSRSRNALLRTGVGDDLAPLSSLTFGDLLDLPMIGVKTALETAALLELVMPVGDPTTLSTPGMGEGVGPSPVCVARWGDPGSPLLPHALRRAFADDALPPWVLNDLDLPSDATALALDSSVWHRLDRLPARVKRFIIYLVTYRADEISNLRVLAGSWPSSHRPETVNWPTRVQNALARAALLDTERLERVTFGDLLSIPSMGVQSVLEFAAVVEGLPQVESDGQVRVLDVGTRQELLAVVDEEWAERVRADDPRFRDVVPPYSGSLSELLEEAISIPNGHRAHVIADSLTNIRARAQEVASEPIDMAMVRLLSSFGASDRDVAIAAARFGWRDGRPRTLQEVGDQFSITRERVRQIAKRTVERVHHAYLPQVERAVELVTDHAPIAADEAAQLLPARNLSTVPLDPNSLRTAAELVGYDVTFQIETTDGIPYVVAQGVSGAGPVFSVARREAGRVGVSNIEEVQAELAVNGFDYSTEILARILHGSARVEFLEDDWFWMPDVPPTRNRLRNVSQRILSVTPRLDVATIRHGVRRRYRFLRIDLVPPINVLKAFFAANPEFVLNSDSTIESAVPLDYRDVLGEVEQILVEVLQNSPTGLMDRAELEENVIGRGVNASTFSVLTTYSPVLDHPAINVWSLRGRAVDPAQLEALRAVLATRTRRRRTLAHGWSDDGNLWLATDLANVNSPVVGIPAAIARYVAGRRFEAKTQDGANAGVITIDERGTSWGYGPFLRRRGAEPGDALTLSFDLVNDEVTLTLEDAAALVEDVR